MLKLSPSVIIRLIIIMNVFCVSNSFRDRPTCAYSSVHVTCQGVIVSHLGIRGPCYNFRLIEIERSW